MSALFPGSIWIYLVGALLLTGAGAYGGAQVTAWAKDETISAMKLADANAEKAAIKDALAKQQSIDAANQKAAVADASAQQQIITQTKTITKTVKEYVHDQIVCPGGVTFGIVRVLYAAEHGIDTASVPLPASVTNDTCAAYGQSALTSDLAADFGAGRANAQQLNDLIASVIENDKLGTAPAQ